MGGGTTIVEALCQGRRALGVDLNPLSRLIAGAKTTPLSPTEHSRVAGWAYELASTIASHSEAIEGRVEPRLKNLPLRVEGWFRLAKASTRTLHTSKEKRLARCILLQWGQALLEKRTLPGAAQANESLLQITGSSLRGIHLFTQQAVAQGHTKRSLTSRRTLHCAPAELFPFADNVTDGARPVVTSPPYPGVHAIYHRWQVSGRKETPAPYYLASRRDGHGESHYNLGGRHEKGLQSYFPRITAAFANLKPALAANAIVFQVLGFSSPEEQAPLYLLAMERAGYELVTLSEDTRPLALSRHIPHRKWYATSNTQASGKEYLFCHSPI